MEAFQMGLCTDFNAGENKNKWKFKVPNKIRKHFNTPMKKANSFHSLEVNNSPIHIATFLKNRITDWLSQ